MHKQFKYRLLGSSHAQNSANSVNKICKSTAWKTLKQHISDTLKYTHVQEHRPKHPHQFIPLTTWHYTTTTQNVYLLLCNDKVSNSSSHITNLWFHLTYMFTPHYKHKNTIVPRTHSLCQKYVGYSMLPVITMLNTGKKFQCLVELKELLYSLSRGLMCQKYDGNCTTLPKK